MPPALLDTLRLPPAREAELLVIEGVMGLFDGVGGPPGRRGATADLAARFGLPVLLVLDVTGSRSRPPRCVRGLRDARSAVRDRRRHSQSRRQRTPPRLVADAIADSASRCSARSPRDDAMALPERHLGLVQAGEHSDLAARLDRLAGIVRAAISISTP